MAPYVRAGARWQRSLHTEQSIDCGRALPGRWNRMADQRSAQATIGALSETVGRSDRLC